MYKRETSRERKNNRVLRYVHVTVRVGEREDENGAKKKFFYSAQYNYGSNAKKRAYRRGSVLRRLKLRREYAQSN